MRHTFHAFSDQGPLDISRIPGTGGPAPFISAPSTDAIVFRRLLDLQDVLRVQEWLGNRAAGRRWVTQVRLFAGFHVGCAKKGLGLARIRMRENSCPLDRQLRDAVEFSWLWVAIAAMAAARFAGVPLEHQLQKSYRRMCATLAPDVMPIAQPWRVG